MKKAPISVLITRLQESFYALNIVISDAEVERIAVIIHDSMTGQMRQYHNIQHVFGVVEPFTEPLQVFACLFHDMVYFQVDKGFSKHVGKVVEEFIQTPNNQILVQPSGADLPTWWDLLLDVFGFRVGEQLSFYMGANEFMSAIIALHTLEPYLSLRQLLKIAICIEGTIPFRGYDLEGNTHFEASEKKLAQIDLKYNLGLAEGDIIEMLHSAVAVANQDVANFANTDTAEFLDTTWLLIYESNENLNNTENVLYSTTNYREGLMKTEGFLKNLKTAHIFHQYRNAPKQVEYARLTHQAQRNMAVAREYMAAKVCLATLLEALAYETGGDAPMSLMVGMVRTERDKDVQRAEDYLPPLHEHEKRVCNPKVLRLLAYGRNEDTDFDMRSSPLTAYLYEMIGTFELVNLIGKAKELFRKEVSYADFIKACPPVLVQRLAQACAQVATTRSKLLEKFFLLN